MSDAGAPPTEVALGLAEDADAVSVAPNWKLVWWRFRKHRLAVVCGVIVICIAIVALFPGFFATQGPHVSNATGSFIPVQRIHFWDEGPSLFVYGVTGARNPRTLRMEWQIDESQKIPLRLLARGYEWNALWLIPTDLHLIGPLDPGQAIHLLGTDRLGRDQWSRLMYGTQVSLSIGLVAVALSTVVGIVSGRDLRLFRRPRRYGHPAPDRAFAVDPADPHLAGADGRPAAHLVGRADLSGDHRDPGADRLDHARPRGARPFPVAARGGFRRRGQAVRQQPDADRLSPHAAVDEQPHHRRDDFGHPGHDHQRDVP